MAIPLIDAHFHLWDSENAAASLGKPLHDGDLLGEPARMHPVYRPQTLRDDVETGRLFSLVGAVHVEAYARDGLEEAKWAAEQAKTCGFPIVVVGRVDLTRDDAIEKLKAMKQQDVDNRLRGIRQILNHGPSWPWVDHDRYFHDANFERAYQALADYQLSFDLQINPHQLPVAAEFARKYTRVPVIINHFGCLKLTGEDDEKKLEDWRKGMQAMAAAGDHVYVKLSMLCYTDADWDAPESIVPSLVHEMIRLFSPQRCMFASNYPVDQPAGWTSQRLWPAVRKLLQSYPQDVQQDLCVRTARRAYRMDDH